MNILKKILSSAIIITLILANIGNSFAIGDLQYLAKEKIMTKSKLHKVIKGRDYSLAMDNLVEKLGDDVERKQKILNKVNLLLDQLYNKYSLTSKEEKTLLILQYLSISLEYNLALIQQESENQKDDVINTILNQIETNTLSDLDKALVENAFIEIQKSTLDEVKTVYKTIEDKIISESNYQSTGDFEMQYDIQHDSIGEYNGKISFGDYTIKNSMLDSQITGELEAAINSIAQGEDMSVQLKSTIDMIQKNGGIYAILKDLEITTNEEIEEIQEFVERTKKLAEENKYLDFSDQSTQYFYEYINAFNSEKLFADLSTYSDKSLFSAYKKIDNDYYIIPTKYACDSIKELSNVFDPFSGNTCSENQYKDMLSEFLSFGELTMQIGDDYTLNFNAYEFENIEEFNFTTTFNSQEISSISFQIIPDQTQYLNEKITLEYNKNNNLDFHLNISDADANIVFLGKLDRNNTFDSIDFEAKLNSGYEIISSDLLLENNRFTGNMKFQEIENTYDENWEITGKSISGEFNLDIKGDTDYKNQLENISGDFKATQAENELFSGDFEFDLPNIVFNIQTTQEYSNTDFSLNFDSKYNKDENYFYDMDLVSSYKTQDYIYNYDTWEREYIGDVVTVFDTNYTIKNNNLNGTITIKNMENQNIIDVETSGTYSANKGNIKNIITLGEELNINSQLKKSRNTVRVSNLKMLQAAIEQSYQDYSQYPTLENFNQRVLDYIWEIPQDEFSGKIIDGCKFGYTYNVDNAQGIENQVYKISSCFESEAGWDERMKKDGGIYDNKYEIGILTGDFKNQDIYINNITDWETIESNNSQSNPILNFDIIYDYANDKTNVEMFINAIMGDETIAEINIKNTGEIKYSPQTIETPKNIAPVEEILY